MGDNGRIDDPNAGWKGCGVWGNRITEATWHIEVEMTSGPGLVKFHYGRILSRGACNMTDLRAFLGRSQLLRTHYL